MIDELMLFDLIVDESEPTDEQEERRHAAP